MIALDTSQAMLLGFFSDLHLAPPPLSRCATPPDELVRLLDRLLERCDEVVALGDLFDLLRPRRPRGWRTQLAQIRLAYPELMRRLDRCAWLVGNHDAPLASLGVPEERAWASGEGGGALALHGHQWDIWLKRVWGLEEAANFGVGWCERAGVPWIGSGVGAVPHVLGRLTAGLSQAPDAPTFEGGEPGRHLEGAACSLAQGREVVIAGHSHALGLHVTEGGGLFINTGSHAHGCCDWAALELIEGAAMTARDDTPAQLAARDARGRWRLVEPGHSAPADRLVATLCVPEP